MIRMKNTPTFDLSLRAVIYREGDMHLAHCLELDLAGEGNTRAEAVKTLIELIQIQVEAALADGDISSIFRPAPAEYWRLFTQAEPVPSSRLGRLAGRLESRNLVLSCSTS
jgi:hypothetical protein